MEAGSLTAPPSPGRMQVDALDRITNCANKLGSGWQIERKYSERPDDEGHGEHVDWVETAAACCCCCRGESAPPTYEQASNDKEKRHGAKLLAALRRVEPDGYGAPWISQPV